METPEKSSSAGISGDSQRTSEGRIKNPSGGAPRACAAPVQRWQAVQQKRATSARYAVPGAWQPQRAVVLWRQSSDTLLVCCGCELLKEGLPYPGRNAVDPALEPDTFLHRSCDLFGSALKEAQSAHSRAGVTCLHSPPLHPGRAALQSSQERLPQPEPLALAFGRVVSS
jgi:hypothetical protein